MGFRSIIDRALDRVLGTKSLPVAASNGGTHVITDAYRDRRSPTARELVRNFLGTAYTCGTLNADLVASTPIRLYVRTRPGQAKSRLSQRGRTKKVSKAQREWLTKASQSAALMAGAEDVEEVIDHPMLDLIRKPMGDGVDGVAFSLYELMEMTQRYLEISGKCYWYTPRDGLGDCPTQIWLLPPQYVTEVPSYGGDRLIDSYLFSMGMKSQSYKPEEIIPFRMPDPSNPYNGGFSPLMACFEQVTVFREYSAQTLAILKNGGRPDAIWSPKGDSEGGSIGPAEAARMRLAIRQAFSQAGRGGLFVSEYPGAVSPLTWPTSEIMSTEQTVQITAQIANCFQVPTTKLNRADSTLASAATGDYAHAKDAGVPRCNRFASTLNAFFVPMFDPDDRLFFAFDSCVPEDKASKVQQLKDGASVGAVTRNEFRDAVGLPETDWGNTPLVPSNMVGVDPSGNPIPPQNPFASLMGGGSQTQGTEDAAKQNAASQAQIASVLTTLQQIMGKMVADGARKTAVPSAAKINETPSGMARPLPAGQSIAVTLRSEFEAQRRELTAMLQGKSIGSVHTKDDRKPDDLPPKFTPESKWTSQMAEAVQPMIEVIVREEGKRLLTRVGASADVFSVFEKRIPEAAKKLTLKFCDDTNATTTQKLNEALDNLRQELAEGLVEGDGIPELTKRVNEVFDEASKVRAETIARTEACRATHEGELMGAKDSGVVSTKYWMLSEDACPVCYAMAAKGPIALDSTFAEFGGEYGSIDSPPAHPNCVCSLGYSTKDNGQ